MNFIKLYKPYNQSEKQNEYKFYELVLLVRGEGGLPQVFPESFSNFKKEQ